MSGKWSADSDVGVSVSVETFSRLEAFLGELSLAGPFGSLGEMSRFERVRGGGCPSQKPKFPVNREINRQFRWIQAPSGG
jgi:hypothetical protein